MRGIACKLPEFSQLSGLAQSAISQGIKGYNAGKWADKKNVPVHQSTGDLFFPLGSGLKSDLIESILTEDQRDRIIDVLPGDAEWFEVID